MSPAQVEIIEVFSAIQGEGPIIGRRQIFLRFGRCDVHCVYCDTPLCHVDLPQARVEQRAAQRDFKKVMNPVSLDDLASWVIQLDEPRGLHHSISLTGGEPLLHGQAIKTMAPRFQERGLKLYLETNGHLVSELRDLIDVIDLVGMDIKIASATGFPARHDENREFLRVCRDAGREVFCKIVVGASIGNDELLAALQVVDDVAPFTPVILQPVTPFAGKGEAPSPERMLELDTLARSRLPEVLVIPQTHKMIQQL